MSLHNKEASKHKQNSFWRAVVVSDEALATMNETIKLSIDSKLKLVGTVESLVKDQQNSKAMNSVNHGPNAQSRTTWLRLMQNT